MRNILEGAQLVGAHIQQAVLEGLIREPFSALGIHYVYAVNLKMIGVDIGLCGTDSCGPNAVCAFCHFHVLTELGPDLNGLGVIVTIVESHCVIRIDNG